jgi:hypothetical protein
MEAISALVRRIKDIAPEVYDPVAFPGKVCKLWPMGCFWCCRSGRCAQ